MVCTKLESSDRSTKTPTIPVRKLSRVVRFSTLQSSTSSSTGNRKVLPSPHRLSTNPRNPLRESQRKHMKDMFGISSCRKIARGHLPLVLLIASPPVPNPRHPLSAMLELTLLLQVVLVALVVSGICLIFTKKLWRKPITYEAVGVPVRGWNVRGRNSGIHARGRIALNSPMTWLHED